MIILEILCWFSLAVIVSIIPVSKPLLVNVVVIIVVNLVGWVNFLLIGLLLIVDYTVVVDISTEDNRKRLFQKEEPNVIKRVGKLKPFLHQN